MVILQDDLNIKYGGVNWRDNVTMGKAKFAVLDEVSEFLREIESDWKWWKPSATYHKQKALYELIDVVHFALLIMLKEYDVRDIVSTIDEQGAGTTLFGPWDDPYNIFAESIANLISGAEGADIDDFLVYICNIIQTGGELLGCTDPQDLYNAYIMKNQRNHERVDGGVLVGKYDKSKESDIPE
jgi:dimeric dUTPase (all-alpha-NTP-PPase superfamily)